MQDLMMYFAIIAISGMVFLPLHIVVLRARRGWLISSINVTIGISAVIGVATGWLLLGDEFSSHSSRLLGCVAGGLTFFAYAGLYGLLGPSSVDRSFSAHIVELVYRGPGHRLSEADLFRLYTHADVIRKRFDDCIGTGIIERRGDELIVTQRGARIAQFYIAIGNLLGMRRWYLDRYWEEAKAPKT